MAVTNPVSRYDGNTADQEGEFSIKEYLGVLLEGWPFILGLAVLALIFGVYYAWSQPPVYQATSLVRIEQQNSKAQESLLLSSEFGPQSSVPAESAVLGSRSVLGDAVDRLNLQIQSMPVYWGGIGRAIAFWRNGERLATPPLGLLPAYAWGGEHIVVSKLELPIGVTQASFILIAQEGGNYILETPKGGIILEGRAGKSASTSFQGSTLTTRVDQLQARPGTRFIVEYRSRDEMIESMSARLSVGEVGRNSGILRLALRAASPIAAESQLNAIMDVYLEDNVEKQSEEASQRLIFLKEQLPELKQQRDTAEEQLRTFQESAGLLDLDTEAKSLLGRLTVLDQALEELRFQKEELLRRYTAQHPAVESVDSKIGRLLQERRKYEQGVKRLPQAESALLELRRDVEVSNKLYLQLLNQAQELEIARAGITGFVHVVDEAYSPTRKVEPKRLRIIALFLFAGLVLGATLVLLRELLKSTLREPDELEERIGLPVYASVPYSTKENAINKDGITSLPLALLDGEDLAVESLRSFRTSLQFALMETENSCIAFSGPTPGCGKSFISMNVAVLLAQSGKSVALIDADLRRGHLRKSFGISKSVSGLSECMAGNASLDDSLIKIPDLPLSVLPAGRYPPNPSELLMSPTLKVLIDRLNEKFDYVVLDLPPVLNVSDATIVAHLADAVFMVVRADQSTLHDVEQARKRLNRDDVSLKGLLFNGFKPNRLRYGYAKYGYYTYRYNKSD